MLRTSRILTLTPLRINLSWRKRSTCNRPIISTIRLSAMYLRRSTRPVLPPSTVVASECPAVSLVPTAAACELSILRLGAVTQDGIDVGAKRASIRRRRHERVVEVHVHLSEERMEPVIHSCRRCIVGDVGAESSNHLSSNEQYVLTRSK